MVEFDVESVNYRDYTNWQLAGPPLAVLTLALLVIAGWSVFVTGTPTAPGIPVSPGIEFTGGTELQLQTDVPRGEIPARFEREVVSVRPITTAQNTYILTFQSTDVDALETRAQSIGTVQSTQSTSPSFGQNTQLLAVFGVATAFVGMSVVVFLLFRTFIPSIAVVISAFSDIMIPMALMNIFGIKLSLGTVAALLMLIGYSVDSDILLNNYILRRSGGFYENTYRAMRTGVTMTLTSISAMTVMTIVSFLFGIDLLTAIGTVLIFGLTADLMNTYMLNLSLLRWYRGISP